MRRLAFFVLLLLSFAARADYPATGTPGTIYFTGAGTLAVTGDPTPEGSCHKFRLNYRSYPFDAVINGQCYMGYSAPTTSNFAEAVGINQTTGTVYSCPNGGTLDGTNCVQTNPCTQGTTEDKNMTVGWARATARPDGAPWSTADGRNYYAPAKAGAALPGDVAIPETMCDGQCTWVADGAPGDFWVNQDPGATGMHAIYRSQSYIRTGAQCSGKTPAADPSATPPACDGFVGQVNGVTKCIAKEPPSGVTGSVVPSGPKSTSSGAGAAPTDVPAKKFGPNGEQPGKAGDVPSVLDLGGTGTGAGTVSKSSSGVTTGKTVTNPDGSTTTTTTTTFDIEVCGLPGKPACKLDESGTPTKVDASSAMDQLKGAADSRDGLLSSIQSKGDKDTSWSMPSWLSPASCHPWVLGTFPVINVALTIDICVIVPYVNGVMSFLWVVGTFFATLAMVGRVMGAGVN